MRIPSLLPKLHTRNCLLFARRKITYSGRHCYIQNSSSDIKNSRVIFPRKKFPDNIDKNLKEHRFTDSVESCANMSIKRMKLDSENIKSRPSKSASFASLEVISNGTTHTGPCVVLKTEKKTYLFNCPEGTCRFHSSIRLRPNTTFDFFITRGSWDCFGGVSSILMSKDDIRSTSPQECRLHGPKGIRQYLDDLRPFMDSDRNIEKYPMLMEERSYEKKSYDDEILVVQYIPLIGSNSSPDREDVDVAYFVELKMPPMKVDFMKIITLKIPPGPLIGQLKDGFPVTLDDGRTILPEQIHADDQLDKGKCFLVADVLSEEKLDCLANSTVMQNFSKGSEQLGSIVHFTPQDLLKSEKYSKWMQSFGEKCEHIIVNGSGTVSPQLDAPYLQQMMLNTLDPIAFPLLYPSDFRGVVTQDSGGESPAQNVFVPTSLRRFPIRGKLPVSDLLEFSFSDSGLSKRIEAAPMATTLIEQFHEYTNSIVDNGEDRYPQITFLGTSSATCTRYRALSANLLHLNKNSIILVDCGELTYGQMRVLYGEEECERTLLNLHTICLTHAHQDHINGLALLLERRESLFKKHGLEYKPVVLVCSRIARKPLSIYSKNFEDLEKLVVSIDTMSLLKPLGSLSDNADMDVGRMSLFPTELYSREKWNLANVETVKVKHVAYSTAFIFTEAKHGRRVVFSGDTMPCDNLVERGKNCDILIHEATFQDILKQDALNKKHSTMEQAVDVGCRMNAKHIFLTHFSARYNKVPILPDYLDEAGNISIAMDNMVVRFDRLHVFPKLLPIYREIYLEELLRAEETTLRFSVTRK